MKKKVLLVVLSLAILTSLTAGTLAVYTRTDELKAEVTAKRFAFSVAGGIENDLKAINLAPTESMNYNFTIANTENGVTAEVPMEYEVIVDIAEAAKAMPGLQATVYFGDEVVEKTTTKVSIFANSAADKPFENAYRVDLTWVDNGDNSGHTDAGANSDGGQLKVTVAATQSTVVETAGN